MTDILIDLDLFEKIMNDEVTCTSRSPHRCTTQATHACRTTFPCTDPADIIYWCSSRYAAHQHRSADGISCAFCNRSIFDCWKVLPI